MPASWGNGRTWIRSWPIWSIGWNWGGEQNVCLGGDLDGCSLLPEGIKGIQDLDRLWERLLQRNYSEALLRALFFENLMRVVSEVCTM